MILILRQLFQALMFNHGYSRTNVANSLALNATAVESAQHNLLFGCYLGKPTAFHEHTFRPLAWVYSAY